jgi:hypothetical protein
MFRPPIMAIFREVFFEGCITKDIKTNLQIRNIKFKIYGLKCMLNYIYNTDNIPKKFQQDDTLVQYFIISCKSLYMFRVRNSPIIRSSIKLYLQHLVLTNWMSRNSSTTTAGHTLFVNTRCCKYNLIERLMMGEFLTRNM